MLESERTHTLARLRLINLQMRLSNKTRQPQNLENIYYVLSNFTLSRNVLSYCTDLSSYFIATIHWSAIPLRSWRSCSFFKLPYSLFLAHSALSIFKITLKMFGEIATQLAHHDNEKITSRGRPSWLYLHSEVTSNATAN